MAPSGGSGGAADGAGARGGTGLITPATGGCAGSTSRGGAGKATGDWDGTTRAGSGSETTGTPMRGVPVRLRRSSTESGLAGGGTTGARIVAAGSLAGTRVRSGADGAPCADAGAAPWMGGGATGTGAGGAPSTGGGATAAGGPDAARVDGGGAAPTVAAEGTCAEGT